ncbi:hypothetical protein AURDEDRAFT_175517 [Auricularia subglabra TFB-10046 SS5]|uniref:Uncharacterized protein n=1 Tax=Auricularia subglabra (strain TFB-10046 / SS5) TaxID=717982 RepID=J0LET7_AURST|nr:hypothetical protein AURDEDRAFT_175517 [Auricularia subglabra TFB-10046 SS5]
MSRPERTYALLGEDWSEASVDWASIKPQFSLKPPILDDIDWDKVDVDETPKPQDGSNRPSEHLRILLNAQTAQAASLDPERVLQFGTYESTVTMASRDILYRRTEERANADPVHIHVNPAARSNAHGWALVPCVAMRLCYIKNELCVYAARYAEDIWRDMSKNELNPHPGTYDKERNFSHNHPLPVHPPRVLVVRIAGWMRRLLQVLFHTAAYHYYHRCQVYASLTDLPLEQRREEAYYHELMSNIFAEFAEFVALDEKGVHEGPIQSLSTAHHYFIREWHREKGSCHNMGFSQRLLDVLPNAYQQDPSQFDWEGTYYENVKALFKFANEKESPFAYWRMNRSLALDLFTDDFTLDFSMCHTVWDMDWIPARPSSIEPQWCILGRKYALGFDATPDKVHSDLYPIVEYDQHDTDVFMATDSDEIDCKVLAA